MTIFNLETYFYINNKSLSKEICNDIINYFDESIIRYEHVDIIIYTFTSLERIQPIFRTLRIRRNLNSRYKYRTELLNICKNLTV